MSDRPLQHPPQTDTKQRAREQRRVRLEAELRSNLRKRKEQARGRVPPGASGSDNGNDQPDALEAATSPTGEVA
jgi:ribosome assembly protein YihI (activator of Der GTPase)